jgi:hypothetical protein
LANGNNLEKEEINRKKEKEEKQLIALTLTGLLMEGVESLFGKARLVGIMNILACS